MDTFSSLPTTLTSPARDAAPAVPSDTAILFQLTRAIYVGQTGNLAIETAAGQQVIFQNMQAGSVLPMRATKILQTGTTAGGIIVLW